VNDAEKDWRFMLKTRTKAPTAILLFALSGLPLTACGSSDEADADESEAGDAGWVLLEAGPGSDNPDSAASGCHDGVQNGDESDVDCGGSCPACNDYRRCEQDGDCSSGLCLDNICQASPGHCANGVQDDDESDVDCGGSCARCAAGLSCVTESDCTSGVCTQLVCQAPACDDQVANGSETDVDCGGPDCEPCGFGDDCEQDSDCESNNCGPGGTCVEPDYCSDAEQNEDETGVDCGGGTCPPCAVGEGCLQDSDCSSGSCVSEVCRAPSCEDQQLNGTETDVDCGAVASRARTASAAWRAATARAACATARSANRQAAQMA
jgi:hypothetical protein